MIGFSFIFELPSASKIVVKVNGYPEDYTLETYSAETDRDFYVLDKEDAEALQEAIKVQWNARRVEGYL